MKPLLILALASLAHAAYPAVDYFHRGNNKGAYWTPTTTGQFQYDAAVRGSANSGTRDALVWTRDGLPSNDQHVEVILADATWDIRGGTSNSGVGVRLAWDGVSSTATKTGYICELVASNGYNLRIIEWTAGSAAVLVTGSTTATSPQQNDRLHMWAISSTIRCVLYSGLTGSSERIAEISTTDSTITSGYGAITKNTTGIYFDDFHVWNEGAIQPLRAWTCNPCTISDTGTENGTGVVDPTVPIDSPLTLNWLVDKLEGMGPGITVYYRGILVPDSNRFVKFAAPAAHIPITGAGTVGSPVLIKPYPGEDSTFDVAITPDLALDGYFSILLDGTYTELWGGKEPLNGVLTNTETSRVICGGPHRPYGVGFAGNGNSVKYMTLHDLGQVITSESVPTNTGVLGNIIINGGDNNVNGIFGHAVYAQNPAGGSIKTFEGNFVSHLNTSKRAGGAIQMYSQSGGDVVNIRWHDNTVFDVYWFYWQGPLTGAQIIRHRQYGTRNGFRFQVDSLNTNLVLTDSHLHDASFDIKYLDHSDMSRNIFASRVQTANAYVFDVLSSDACCDTLLEQFNPFADNVFYQIQDGTGLDFITKTDGVSPVSRTFSGMMTATGGTGNSLITDKYPAMAKTFPDATSTNYTYRWNSPDFDRAHITTYNYKGDATVPYDPSDILTAGQSWKLWDVQCFACGPVATGTWTSGNISLPMTLTAVTAPIGNYTADPNTTCGGSGGIAIGTKAHTSSEFGTFILTGDSASTANVKVRGNVRTVGNVTIR